MPFQIIRNDITKVKADAIVNTANPKPVIGGGTDSAIYQAAGREQLLEARKKIGSIEPGQAVYTDAFGLDARYIIHTVGPAWVDGNHGEREILHACYRNSLALAASLKCASIAFPLIATGVYGFPRDEALQIALGEISGFLLAHDMEVILVVFDRKSFELSGRLIDDIEEYIDENAVHEIHQEEYSERRREEYRALVMAHHMDSSGVDGSGGGGVNDEGSNALAVCAGTANSEEVFTDKAVLDAVFTDEAVPGTDVPSETFSDMSGKSLDEIMANTGDTFQQRLFELIDERGLDDVTVYKKANIDRKVFSRIRCKADYKPRKKTAVAFAIALELDMPTMLDLLSRAEIAFSPSNRFDLIIMYFINNKVYDIYEINAALFKYGQPILGE